MKPCGQPVWFDHLPFSFVSPSESPHAAELGGQSLGHQTESGSTHHRFPRGTHPLLSSPIDESASTLPAPSE